MSKPILARVGAFILFCSFSVGVLADPLPVKAFSQLPSYQQPQLSPNGLQIAYKTNMGLKNDEGLTVLSVYDLVRGKNQYILQTDNEKVKLNWFEWANDEVLLMSVRFASTRYRVDTMETRLIAINVSGDEAVQRNLIKPRSHRGEHFSQFQDSILDYLPDDPEHVLIALDLDQANNPSVYKVNIYTSRMRRVVKERYGIRAWYTDRQSRVRMGYAINYKSGDRTIYHKALGTDDWEPLFKFGNNSINQVRIKGFGLNPNVVYLTRYLNDKLALYKMDLTTQQQELVFADPDYDVSGSLIYSRKSRDVIGVYHGNSATGRIFWDEDRAKFIQQINKALPDTHNYLVDMDAQENRYVVYSERDNVPGKYLLGDRKEKSMQVIFEQYPDIPMEHTLSAHKKITFKTRDGLELEGYLTLPPNTDGPVPFVMHPHGGPGARDVSGFDYWTSFFSDQGYGVFRPNFRGSSGYGYDFSMAQMKGWGLQMQDDITDAAHMLVEEGYAQPDNMCIVGASYGGYAAAMAATKTPDLFKCSISFAGVFDLKSLVASHYNYVNYNQVKEQIGDDSDDLEARSPYYHVDKVKIPMLIIHGEKDRVVDVKQSREFVDELEDEDKKVQYIELDNGDHHLSIQRNRHITFAAMQAFLAEHLK